jgi:hypothetical protein
MDRKIQGKVHYFGPWNDPDAALNNYLAREEDLHAGFGEDLKYLESSEMFDSLSLGSRSPASSSDPQRIAF